MYIYNYIIIYYMMYIGPELTLFTSKFHGPPGPRASLVFFGPRHSVGSRRSHVPSPSSQSVSVRRAVGTRASRRP